MKKNILLIDDDPLVIKSVSRYLRSCGYNVATAQSSDEACGQINGVPVDLIVSDIRMPQVDGMETLKRIRELMEIQNKPRIPALVITAYAQDEELKQKAEVLGVVECVYKPFCIGELNNAIRRCLELPPSYQRACSRFEVVYPLTVRIALSGDTTENVFSGSVSDISEDGLGCVSNILLPRSTLANVSLNSSPDYTLFQSQALIVWSKPSSEEGLFRAGLHFLKIEDAYMSILMEILAEYKLLDKGFIGLIKQLKGFLAETKERLDADDLQQAGKRSEQQAIEENKHSLVERLNGYFDKIWDIIKDLNKDAYELHQHYYQHILGGLLLDCIETNRHVYERPLGYSGDYLMMNYIYDYHKDDYLGHSTYEKLINHYTCNIPISCSNIARKDFLKERIAEALRKKEKPRVLSFGCGPARELLELTREGKITEPLVFYCYDGEKKALEYIQAELEKIDFPRRRLLFMEYVCRDVAALIRDKKLKHELRHQDLIYAFGIFDYLNDKMAARLAAEFYHLLQENGRMYIFNAAMQKSCSRAYYELLGGWHLVYRTEEQMLAWAKDIKGASKIQFTEISENNNYLCLSITK